ncbi:RHS repeat-associated core domain-containing protein [Kibdelosporangium aridum]|uniref:Intein N-terminal splicing region/RHS repeat-associated core domain-containing protein n=1 Tax=Kibdelosporangium aridum TaxID=2030 RepID=A0A1Y5XW18_KIBAR|nr:RHS repeat-associated core domain-containing protein [Kibdelosporangium aridum]SMD20153.1 intein N-terminal splicing region/RHS repeat-associated core domain-containing protein [Kibdelosporangium aridum]
MRSRPIALSVSVALVTTLVQVVTSPVAAAETQPSVPLPSTPSTSVVAPSLASYGEDQASKSTLSGNQPPKTTSPDGHGTTAATSLAPSASWSVASHTGDFSWSYPLRVPPAPGALVPSLALSYRSSEVDGRTSATNNQPSWVGEGWNLSPGFVERTYGSCGDDDMGDVKPPETKGDLCWRTDNATASYSGSGGPLIRDDVTGDWRTKSDDGSRIERREGIANGDDNGEHWVITSMDGTQYWFGSQPDSKSTWTVPVYGDDANEPCHKDTLAASHCVQAYRWMLDKVVDRNGNMIRYHYLTETNKYGMNEQDTAVEYIRGGTLDRIDYGLRDNVTTPSGRVVFELAKRCVPGSDCLEASKNNWPDVSWDNECKATPCKERYPSFWSTKRLASITTQVLRGTTYDDVDRWDLEHSFPDPGDREKASLWLKSIKHTGLVGEGSVTQPAVTFEGTALPNRVDTATDGIAPMYRYRITGVRSETGGLVSITYTSQCEPDSLPAKPEENEQWCFPVVWAPKNFAERTDYFHKYMVTKVITSDRLRVQNNQALSSPEQVVSYEYLDGAAWHRDTSEFTKDSKKTYNEFRGFSRVRTRMGAPGDPSGKVTMSEERFYQGMDGDKLPNGTRPASVSDSHGGTYPDSDWLQGFGFESSTFVHEGPSDKPDPPRLSKAISKPFVRGPTAKRGDLTAYIVRTETARSFTALSSGQWRITRTDTDYDDRGLPTKINDLGDIDNAADDRCVRNTYARNTDKWILGLIGHTETVSVNCDTPAVYPRDALSATRNTYDDNGNTKKIEQATERPASEPSYLTKSTMDYDAHGRITVLKDAHGRATTTVYTPQLGGPLTQTVVTTPAPRTGVTGLATTTTLEPAWGSPTKTSDPNNRVTTLVYDAAGRKTQTWLPNQPTTGKPSVKYDYLIRNDGASVVTTTKLGPNKTEITSKTLYDGLLRPRQTQAPALGGGRLLTDIRYDSFGRQWKATQPYYNSGSVDDTLWLASDTEIPGHTRSYYDDAGRVSVSAYFAGAFEKWRTTKTYDGDRVNITPPSGATPVTTITDARGQMVEQRKYHGTKAEGDYDATLYSYTKAGHLETVTDPLSKIWRYKYDFRGRMTEQEDPDSGTSITSYDDLDRVTSSRDGRGETVAFEYDNLDRRIATYVGQVGGTKLAEWTYDTVIKGKGQLASSTRWVNGAAYTRNVLSYDQVYNQTGTSLTIPAKEGLLAGTYETYASFNVNGSVGSQGYAKAGELPAESVSYKYDDLGPVLQSWGGYNGSTFHYGSATEYTRYGEIQRLRLGSGDRRVWQSYYYDTSTRRLNRSIVDAELPSPMQTDTRYTYSPAGTITSVADVPLGKPADIQCFQQDYLRRTTEAWTTTAANWTADQGCTTQPSLTSSGPAPYWHSYTYDKSGNRKSETQHGSNGDTTRTYEYDVLGHAHALKSVTTKGFGVDTKEDYEYNASGSVIRKGDQTFTWDVEGKLTGVSKDGTSTTFLHDAEGNRLIRRDPDATTLYLGGQELRVAVGGGNPTVTRYYRHGGQIVAVRQGNGSLTWLAGDHQGTGQIAINAGTLEVTQRRQLPFGAPRGAAVQWPGDRGFVGGVEDKSTGLTHLGARDYDPSTGRFISVDPVLNPSDSQQINGYTYSNNNPITFSDPSGAFCDSCDFYGREDEKNGGSGSIWTPVPPGQPTKPNAPTGYDKGDKIGQRAAIIDGRNKDATKQPIIFDRRMPTFDELKALRLTGVGYSDGEYAKALKDWAKHVCRRSVGNEGFCSYVQDLGMLDIEKSPVADFIIGLTPLGVLQSASECATGESSCWWMVADIPVLKAAKLLKSGKAAKACSFTADTKVVMADGTTKPISEVKLGDKVLAADPETGAKGVKTVTGLSRHQDSVLDLVTEDGGTVTTTADHPFWNASDGQWQRADQLDAGDSLVTAAGDHVAFRELKPETRRSTAAYNLSVLDLESYYVLVGDDPILVHNERTCDIDEIGLPIKGDHVLVRHGEVINGDIEGNVIVRGGTVNGNIKGNVVITHGGTVNGNVEGTVVQVGQIGDDIGPEVQTNLLRGDVHGTLMQIGYLEGRIFFPGLTVG